MPAQEREGWVWVGFAMMALSMDASAIRAGLVGLLLGSALAVAASSYVTSSKSAQPSIIPEQAVKAVVSTSAATSSVSTGKLQKDKRTLADVLEAEREEEESGEDGDLPDDVQLKMVVLVRNDLNMSKGKIAAQVGHAVLGAYRIATRLVPEYVKAWLFRAQAKITLKVDDEKTMDAVAQACREAGLPVCIVEDAGRTEVEPGTRTVCGIGPAPKAEIDAVTGPKGKFPLRLLT